MKVNINKELSKKMKQNYKTDADLSWTDFYMEFADKLRFYYDDRKTLIEKIRKIYADININLPTLEKNNEIIDIDPFTIFGLFNKGISELNRKKIVSAIAKEFSIEAKEPENFDGVPVLNNMNATFYYFINERGENDIENLWLFFLEALDLASKNEHDSEGIKRFIDLYDRVTQQKGTKWNLTMGLFWIRPYRYINLDEKNRDFIIKCGLIKNDGLKKLPHGLAYLSECDYMKEKIKKVSQYDTFPKLSHEAWVYSQVEYWPSLEEYNPGITKEQWLVLLTNPTVTYPENLKMFKMMLELGGESTCTNLAEIYGNSYGTYNTLGRSFGQRVHKVTNCPLFQDEERTRLYTIPFVGKYIMENGKQRYLWKLRPELKAALEEMKLPEIVIGSFEERTMKFNINTILYGPPGTGKTYNTAIYAVAICDGEDIEEVKEWEYQEVLERYKALMSEGRVAFTTFHQSYGYEEFIEGIKPQTKPDNKDVFYEVVPGIFKEFCEKAESVEVKADTFEVAKDAVVWKATIRNEVAQDCYDNNRVRIDWGMESEGAAGFVQDMKKGDIVIVNDGSRSIINGIAVIISDEAFSLGTQNDATTRNVQWLAKGLKEDICNINDGKMLHRMTCCRVPSMTVNDILALAVKKNKDLKNTKIEKNNEPHVFIIDEINRGNISKIFGELITLIEDSKRAGMKEEASAILPYSGKKFSVPQNVYIIGTMNTADRSIALMDTALRRRFSFMEMMPDAELLADIEIEGINIAKMLDTINKRISYLYDREHTIGHAFFMKLRDDATIEKLAEIFEKQIIPLLQEYFYEDYQKIQLVLGDNAKSDAAYKFIQEKETKVKEIFKGAASLDLDLPEYSFTINKEAFAEAQSYVEIYS